VVENPPSEKENDKNLRNKKENNVGNAPILQTKMRGC